MKQVVVELDEFKVTIKELRIKDVLKVIVNVKEVFGDKDLDLQKLVEEKFDTIIEIATSFITPQGDHTLDEISFSDIDKLIEPFKEVNSSFLDKMGSMGFTLQNLIPPPELDVMPIQSEED